MLPFGNVGAVAQSEVLHLFPQGLPADAQEPGRPGPIALRELEDGQDVVALGFFPNFFERLRRGGERRCSGSPCRLSHPAGGMCKNSAMGPCRYAVFPRNHSIWSSFSFFQRVFRLMPRISAALAFWPPTLRRISSR